MTIIFVDPSDIAQSMKKFTFQSICARNVNVCKVKRPAHNFYSRAIIWDQRPKKNFPNKQFLIHKNLTAMGCEQGVEARPQPTVAESELIWLSSTTCPHGSGSLCSLDKNIQPFPIATLTNFFSFDF